MTDDTRTVAPVTEELGEPECQALIAAGGIGRIAYAGRFGLTVIPVNFRILDGTVVFRTGQDSPLGEDLRTGIAHAEYQVAFEIDEIHPAQREGWSVLIQGSAHHVDDDAEREAVRRAGVQPWAGGQKEHYIRIVPNRITGRRIRQPERRAT